MRQFSKVALFLAPVIIATSGCATKPAWLSKKPVAEPEAPAIASRTERLLEVAEKYEQENKDDLALRLYEHILVQDPQNAEVRQRMLALSGDTNKPAKSIIAKSTETKKTAVVAAKSSKQELPQIVKNERANENDPKEQSSHFAVIEKDATSDVKVVDGFKFIDDVQEEQLIARQKEFTNRSDAALFFPEDKPVGSGTFEWAETDRSVAEVIEATVAEESQVAQETPKSGAWWETTLEEETAPGPSGSAWHAAETESVAIQSEPEISIEMGKTESEIVQTNTLWHAHGEQQTAATPVHPLAEGFSESTSNWKPTSVKRLCQLEASDELILVVALLDSEEPTERIAGLMELGAHGKNAQAVSPAIRALLNDQNPLVRAHAAGTVRDVEESAADVVSHLKELLSNKDQDVVRLSAYLLGQMGSEGSQAVQELEKIRDRGNSLTSLHAAEALTRIAPGEIESYDILRKALNDESRANRLFAAVSLGGVQPEGEALAAVALREALHNDDESVRATAALSLGGLGSNAVIAVDDLTELAKTDSPEVREAAETALACLGHDATK